MFTSSSRITGRTVVRRIALVALASLAAAATLALASPQVARAAVVPSHTQPRFSDNTWWYSYQRCAVRLFPPQVWGLTNNPASEIVGWQPIAWSSNTGYIYGDIAYGWASQTWGQPPLWYNQNGAIARTGTVWVPRGTYWIGFWLQDVTLYGHTWLFPSDGWLFKVTC